MKRPGSSAAPESAPIFPPAGPTPVPGGPGDGAPPGADGPGGPGGAGGSGEPEDSGDDEGASASGERPKKKGSFWKELPLLLVIAIVLALLIKTFLVQAFSIPSESMENTIKVGDRVLVNKFSPWFGAEPERGQVVVFHDPGNWLQEAPKQSDNALVRGLQKGMSWVGLMPSADEKDLIKRVIGVGGDRVQCCDAQGRLMVNGKPLDESSYLKKGVAPSTKTFDVTVPKGRIWLMGDNRDNSSDSRYHMDQDGGGTVDKDQVIGRAFTVVWPLNRIHGLGVPGTFDQPGLGLDVIGNTPLAAGLVGAVPLVLWRRRRAGAPAARVSTRDASGAPPA
ncbi:signal peptidase I [Embleya sp. NBC_00896]|uniref:signal peptidase I n=1 Tax=Embleya sp. NBC_00896 TaxID=2975961 RepID=UPI0038665681|nr:signal peptidase I [Embleya sp. NBC_00896]